MSSAERRLVIVVVVFVGILLEGMCNRGGLGC